MVHFFQRIGEYLEKITIFAHENEKQLLTKNHKSNETYRHQFRQI